MSSMLELQIRYKALACDRLNLNPDERVMHALDDRDIVIEMLGILLGMIKLLESDNGS